VSDEQAHRLFIGVRVSVPTANALASAVETLARRAGSSGLPVRWMSPTLYHVTLKFLGWTQGDAISSLRDGLRDVMQGVEPFTFSTARLGAFPDAQRAKVVWAGVTSRDDALGRLARRIDDMTAERGFASDRPFAGHVTLGRLREPAAVHDVLLPLMEQVFSDTKVTGVSLLESIVKSGSLTYQERCYFACSRAESGRERQSPSLQLGPQDAAFPTGQSGNNTLPRGDSSLHDIETDDGWPRGQGP
jgi:RNA 2',3'-cyclic 3'-phosphodiesterase